MYSMRLLALTTKDTVKVLHREQKICFWCRVRLREWEDKKGLKRSHPVDLELTQERKERDMKREQEFSANEHPSYTKKSSVMGNESLPFNTCYLELQFSCQVNQMTKLDTLLS